jgi:hypothetical protein
MKSNDYRNPELMGGYNVMDLSKRDPFLGFLMSLLMGNGHESYINQ